MGILFKETHRNHKSSADLATRIILGLVKLSDSNAHEVFRDLNWSKLKVVQYSFFWTIPSLFNWRFTNLPLIFNLIDVKITPLVGKDGSLVECVFKGNRYFHGNDISKR